MHKSMKEIGLLYNIVNFLKKKNLRLKHRKSIILKVELGYAKYIHGVPGVQDYQECWNIN